MSAAILALRPPTAVLSAHKSMIAALAAMLDDEATRLDQLAQGLESGLLAEDSGCREAFEQAAAPLRGYAQYLRTTLAADGLWSGETIGVEFLTPI